MRDMIRGVVTRACVGFVVAAVLAAPRWLDAADRAVVWVLAQDRGLERDLNREAARGLRLAAVSDGLPCTVAALQAPETAGPAASYRVVGDREVAAALPALVAEGFVPKASARMVGTRHQVVFERAGVPAAAAEWRAVEFEKLEDLDGALASAARDGFQVGLAVRAPFRSWPGLSEPGLVLARKAATAGPARESRVLVGSNRDLKDVIEPLKTATAQGWTLDGVLTSARDGGRDGRRERVVLMLSRAPGAAAGTGAGIERHRSCGIFGAGARVGAGLFWNDYLPAGAPDERRQIWATPIALSAQEAGCAGIGLKLRFDGMRDQTWDIVALLAKPKEPAGYELAVVTENKLR